MLRRVARFIDRVEDARVEATEPAASRGQPPPCSMSVCARGHVSPPLRSQAGRLGLISALSLPAAARAPQEAPAEAARISHAAGVALADFDEPRVVRALCAALEEPDETVRNRDRAEPRQPPRPRLYSVPRGGGGFLDRAAPRPAAESGARGADSFREARGVHGARDRAGRDAGATVRSRRPIGRSSLRRRGPRPRVLVRTSWHELWSRC
jgi:hypothetical protein